MLHAFRGLLTVGFAALVSVAPSWAGPALMNFDNPAWGDSHAVDETDYASFGVSWDGNNYVAIDADQGQGGTGDFANAPSGVNALFLPFGASVMNVANGFDAFSFFYSAGGASLVRLFDGLDGSGNLLETFNLTVQYNANNCVGDPNGQSCNWTQLTASLASDARSAVFGGGNYYVDNVFVNVLDPAPAADVPEPMSAALAGLAMMALAGQRGLRRRTEVSQD